MPNATGAKRTREYDKLKGQFRKEGRYKGREEEVAGRIVNKQRKELGETRGARQARKAGKAPDRKLPIEGYETMTMAQIMSHLAKLSMAQLRKLKTFESRHKNRKGMMTQFERRLHPA